MLTKDILQKQALDALVESKRVILQWATGVGKGYTSVRAIERLAPKRTLIVVAESAHKDNWRKEFEKAGLEELIKFITIECYASLKNYKDTSWDLIIFDEAHHLGSDIRLDILSSLKSKRVLVLSATLNDYNILDMLHRTFGKFVFSEVTMQMAISNNLLPQPKIFVKPLYLDYTKKDQVIIEEWGRKEKRVIMECDWEDRWSIMKYKKTKYPNVTLRIRCSAYHKYKYLCDQIDYWQKRYFATRSEALKNKWLQLGSVRKAFLGNLKTKEAQTLLNSLSDKKYICFCSSIEQAELLGGSNAIHSKKTNSKEIIDSFNNGETNKLFAVGMLQEGQNLNGIEVGIIIQLDGNERAFIQKFGRSMRAEDPIQYIFYFKYTRDEEYLNKVLEGIDKEYIKEV
jgi:superfamily II DNA or RNA helicase